MTARDRLVLIIVSALALLGIVWVLVISPERSKASKLGKEVATAATALASAESQVANARGDQARYSAAYSSIVNLGKAVPPSEEVPSLIYQLAQASNQKHVEFNSITTTQSGAGTAGAAAAATAATTAGFTQMPFTFIFNGSFSDLYHLFQQLNSATVRTSSGGLQVSGRLLTLQGVKLEPTTSATGGSGTQKLTGTITATAYVLPASQGLTAGATASSPTPAAGATTAASSSSTAAPAPVATIGAAR
jgi:hypothetical protein